MAVATDVFGSSIKRREDPRLITGRGNFLDDIVLPGMVHAAIFRSPYPHARITSLNLERARQLPGVLGVFTAADFADVNPLPCAWPAGGVENKIPPHRVVGSGTARHLGEPL